MKESDISQKWDPRSRVLLSGTTLWFRIGMTMVDLTLEAIDLNSVTYGFKTGMGGAHGEKERDPHARECAPY